VSLDTLFEVEQDDLERRVGLVVAELRKQPGWPADDTRDRMLARDLIGLFPRMNLPAVITAWRQWMADYQPKPGKRVNLRARIVTWCDRERSRPGRRPAGVAGDGGAGRRARIAPCGPADFDGLASSL